MFSLTVWISLLVGLLAYLKFFRKKERSVDLPGPWPLPFVGNALQVEAKFYLSLYKWNLKYGPLCKVYIGSKLPTVLVADPAIAKEMLATDAFVGRATIPEFTLFEGENIGLTNSEGDIWEQQRRFIVRQLRDLGFGKTSLESVIMDEVNEFAERMGALNGAVVDDIKSELSLAAVNSLWSIVAGTRFSQSDPKLKDLARQLSGAFEEAAKSGAILVFMPWSKYVFPEYSGYRPIRWLMNGLVEFVSGTIRDHKETFQDDSPRDFIDVYLKEMKKATDPSSSFYGQAAEKQLIGVISDLFQAGADAISTTMNWAILHLLKQPEILKKLQNEIKSATANYRPVSFQDRSDMPYTLAFINEVLRIGAPPFGVPHRVLFDTEFKGVFYPKGTTIMINLYYIHNDPKLWGDPENFRPERFLSEDGKTVKKIDYLNSFLIGRRQCPGETLAKDSIFLFLTNLLQKFNLVKDPNSPEPDLDPAVSFIVTPKPFKVILEERKDL